MSWLIYIETIGLKIRWPHELFPDSFPDSYYSSKCILTKIKHLNNVFLPLNQHKMVLKQNSKYVFSFEKYFPLDLFWYCNNNNNNNGLRLGSQSC